ncbi:hypothetical protein FQN60_015504 [Etheostoma spectabile]|uniref:PX domain-containing protein n=1 Tax=Etheostoma spectabile TaxID=54343 RepID=A0A5J5CLU4_9PERO|nr:hypothetical protein FQN60_015504 [Etheostoma spectabile]
MAGFLTYLETLKRGLKIDVLREAGRQYPVICFLLLSMVSLTVLLNRYIHILMVFWSFLAGFATFYCSLRPESLVPNIFFTVKLRNKRQEQELFPLGHSCAVCGKIRCNRHRPTLLLENYQPWLDLKVPSKVDASIAEVFELVLENFVYPWYRDITDDEACVDEVDVPAVFADKVMKAVIKHIGIIVTAQEKANNVESLQQAALEEYGTDLHIALHSRKDELLYLRKLTEMLFPYVMPPKATDCSQKRPQSHRPPWFHFYRNMQMSATKSHLEQQDLLFRFMNFLKQEGAVHVLQFCLTVEEFNDKILSPELSDSELQRLHGEVVHIYETYCVDESIDKISFDHFIVEEIRNILQTPAAGSRVSSKELKNQQVCDIDCSAASASYSRNSFSLEENRSFLSAAVQLECLTVLDIMLTPLQQVSLCVSLQVEEATVVMEDDSPAEPASTPGALRNLSAWNITIPYIDIYDDEAKREKIPVFCIDVERNDRKKVGHETEKWSVYRRYLEFYVLESKLTEFHGTFADAQLPSKRIIGPKNHEFLTSKREEFEEYLQRLLQHPELSNSQLLADFLSPYSVESQFLDRMLPDVNLGKIFKSVPGKLIKEKGQNLDPFIQSFFNSCESPKPKPSQPELTILSPSAENSKKLFSDLFKNNANLSERLERKQNRNCFREMVSVDGMYDYMMYVGQVVFHTADWVNCCLAAGRILFKNTFEAYMDQYMQSKLDHILQEHNMVSLITQLRDAVFCESSEERTAEDKQLRAKQTFDEMMKYLPDFVVKCIGQERKYEGIRLLFDGFQQPILNKQMTYVLLDIAVQELFPELTKGVKDAIVM